MRTSQKTSLKVGDVHFGHFFMAAWILRRCASARSALGAAFASFVQLRVNALTFAADAVLNNCRDQLVALAARHAVPTMYFAREFTDAGGLMSYGGDMTDAYRLAGVYAGRILKGEKPADLPTQLATKGE